MKILYRKIISLSLIFLFIGVSVSSAISVDTKSTIVEREEDCNCKEIDSGHLVRLERQLNRLEVYSKLLLKLSKYNPELQEKFDELSNRISTLSSLNIIKEKICYTLIVIGAIIYIIAFDLGHLLYFLSQTPLANGLLYKIIYNLALSFYKIFAYGFYLMSFFDCWDYIS